MKTVLTLKYCRGEYYLLDHYNQNNDYDTRIKKGMLFYKDDSDDIIRAEYSPASKVSRPVIASTIPCENIIQNGMDKNIWFDISPLNLLDIKNINDVFNSIDSNIKSNYSEWIVEINLILVSPDDKSLTKFEPFYAMEKENQFIVLSKII